MGSARSASRSSSWRSSRRWAGSPEVRDGGEARGKENGGESLEDLRKEFAEEGEGELDRLRAEIREKHLSGDLANPAGPSKGREPETPDGGGDLDRFREEAKAKQPEKVGGGAEESEESRVGEEIRTPASDSALADRPQLAEPGGAKAVEVLETVAVRPTQEDLHGPHASEALPDAPDVPIGRAVVEAASTPADKEDKARSDPSTPAVQPENEKHEGVADREQRRDKAETTEPLATFSATALDGPKRFQIETKVFEEKTGVKLGKGKTFAISGDIEGVGEFRKIHTGGSKGEYFPVYLPRDRRDSIMVGDKYNVHVRSVEEVSKSADKLGTFYLTPILESRGNVRFDLTTPSLEKRCGVKLEDGKIYDIKGRIGNSYYFEKVYRVRGDNRHIFIRVPKERADEFKPGEKHEVTILSVTEHRALVTVPKSEVRTKLLLQTRTLESLGVDVESMRKAEESDRLLDVTLRKVSPAGDAPVRRVFGKLEPQRGVLLLNIADAGGKQGDKYEILKVKKLETMDFVNGFNARRGQYGNVTLILEGSKLSIRVAGKNFEAKSHSLNVYELRASLRAKFDPFKKEFSFWFNGETVTAKYGGDKVIDSFSLSAKGLKMTYVGARPEFATRSITELSKKDLADTPQILSGLQLMGEKKEIEGIHPFRADESIRSYIIDRLSLAQVQGDMQGKLERGSIGEDIAATLLNKLGWTETARHPFSSAGIGRGSEKKGTDSIFRSDSTRELYLVEVKWWKNSNTAMQAASEELLRRRPDEEGNQVWGRIGGAYIAVIEYDLGEMEGKLHVKRVW